MARSKVPRVLITGATGALGPRVVEAFVDAGYQVRTLSLDEPAGGILPDGVEARIGDVTDARTVRSALEGIDRVIHLAALLHIVDPPPDLQEQYQRVNVFGTKNLLEQAVEAKVERFVLFSTIAVYGSPPRNRILSEDTAAQPDTMYARSKYEAEQIVLSTLHKNGQAFGTVLRMAAIYGSRVKGNYRRLVTALAKGRFIPIGNGKNRRTLIYDRDAAEAALLAASHPSAGGQLFNVSDGEWHAMNEIIAEICAALGRRPPRARLPAGPVRLVAGVLEGAMRLAGLTSPVTRATVDKYTEDIAVDCGKIRTQLGFIPNYSLREGWRETIVEMRGMGEF